MTRLWAKRLGTATAVWAAVCGLALLVGSRPRPVVLAAMVASCAVLAWLASDLSQETGSASWDTSYHAHARERGEDVRVRRIHRMLADVGQHDTFAREVHPLLVTLIDDRLDVHYGVDRAAYPAAARRILGDELVEFAGHPPPARLSGDPRYLSSILTRIEAL